MGEPSIKSHLGDAFVQVLLIYNDAHHCSLISEGLGDSYAVETVAYNAVENDLGPLVDQVRAGILVWDMPAFGQKEAGMLERLSASTALPVLVFAKDPSPEPARRALQAGVTAYVVDGLIPSRVSALIAITTERFRMINALNVELQRTKAELAARKTIERAKGLIMERRNLSEKDAYDAMRRMAMAQGKTVEAIAETILSISDILP